MVNVIYNKKEFIKFCKENNIKCTQKDDCCVLELPDNLVMVGEFSNSMGIKYDVEQIDNNILIKGFEYHYKSGMRYETCYTFDNSNNQVLAVFGLWGGWKALVKVKDNQRDNIEKILPWIFYTE